MKASRWIGPYRTPEGQPAALHLRLDFRAHQVDGPLHDARRAGTGVPEKEDRLVPTGARPAVTFLQSYILKRGFLDGVEGLTIAYMAAVYNFIKYYKARNMS